MKRSRALVENRRNKVLMALKNNGFVKVGELAEELQVSPLTIRRDLQYLEDNKKLERFYGGATVTGRDPEFATEQDEVKLYRKKDCPVCGLSGGGWGYHLYQYQRHCTADD